MILLGVKEVDRKFSIAGVPKAATLIKRFWDGVNNREKVSVNILFDRHVYSVKYRGRDVVVIEVPRADRRERPVYVGRDVFNGAYRRNGEGDYKCSRERDRIAHLRKSALRRGADFGILTAFCGLDN